MPADRRHYDRVNVGIEPKRLAALREETWFGIRARALAAAPVQALTARVELYPVER